MTKEEEFQVYQEIILELENRGFEIIEQFDLSCKMAWQGWQVSISVKNILAQIKLYPDHKNRLISQFIQQVFQQVQPQKTTKNRFWPRILPVVDNKSLSAPWTQSLLDGKLEVGMVEEGEQSLRFLQPFDLFKKKLSIQILKQESLSNMVWAFEQLEWQNFEEGIWGVEDQNGISSAMVLLLGRKFPMEHEKIAIPTRNHLWICSDYNKLPFFELKVRQAYRQFPYPISEELFSWSSEFEQFYAGVVSL